MDKFPLYGGEKAMGELTVEREGLYTCFLAQCPLPEEGLWCAWAVGDRGELRLGVLEPSGPLAMLRRRFSNRMTAPVGRLLRGEIRPAGAPAEDGDGWEAAEQPETLFRTPWLREQLRGCMGVLCRGAGAGRQAALPYDPGRPFPLPPLFCFAQLRHIRKRDYVVFTFDREERPVFDGL